MSHFSVLVVGDDIDYELAPFHEFECTGNVDEFVQNIDVLDKYRKEFAGATSIQILERPDGSRFYPFENDGSYLPEVEPYYNAMTRDLDLPEGWKKLDDIPASEFETFRSWLESYYSISPVFGTDEPQLHGDHKYSWFRVVDDEVTECVRRTNPNKKWDWYVAGGRWSNFLLNKNGKRVNSLLRRDLDIEGMMNAARKEASDEWDRMRAAMGEHTDWVSWEELTSGDRFKVGDNIDLQAARDFYWSQPAIKAMKSVDTWIGFGTEVENFRLDRDAYGQMKADGSIATFAFLMNREWSERGEMGWFGVTTNEMPKSEWNRLFREKIMSLPGDARLTVVDCHI